MFIHAAEHCNRIGSEHFKRRFPTQESWDCIPKEQKVWEAKLWELSHARVNTKHNYSPDQIRWYDMATISDLPDDKEHEAQQALCLDVILADSLCLKLGF